MSFEFITHFVLHELDELVFDAGALRIRGYDLAFRAVLAQGGIGILGSAVPAAEVACEKAMHHHIRITAYRRGEMSVIREGKAVVAYVIHIVAGLRHSSEGEQLYRSEGRRFAGLVKEGVEGFGNLLPVAGRSHLEAEVAGKVAQGAQLFLIRLVVHPVNEGFLAFLCHELRHSLVGQEHEFLDEPVGLEGSLLIDIDRLAFFVHQHLHLRSLETDGAGCKALLAQLGGQFVQNKHSLANLLRNRTGREGRTLVRLSLVRRLHIVLALDYSLRAVVVETVVRTYHGAAEPAADYPCQRSEFENGRKSQFLLARTQ